MCVVFLKNISYYLDDEPKSNLGLFYRSVLGCQFIKTFGSLETCGAVSICSFFDYLMDERSVGSPLASIELKLIDVDKSYTAEDYPNPRGEIFVRGSNIFAGYWNDMKRSYDSVDPDGWFSVKYIGELLPNGTIQLLERRK
jgi:long-subunit acyl-CoA synthetase (AMP-forming)